MGYSRNILRFFQRFYSIYSRMAVRILSMFRATGCRPQVFNTPRLLQDLKDRMTLQRFLVPIGIFTGYGIRPQCYRSFNPQGIGKAPDGCMNAIPV